MAVPAAGYLPRYPPTDYYRCVEDYFETFVGRYDEHFSRQYGFWRPYIEKVIFRYLDCGDLNNGFARVECKDCGHEYLLAFSCKRRHFCPSCHQKRVVELASGSAWMSSRRALIGISSSAIPPKMAGQARASPYWNGWPTCLRTFPTGASKWSGTMAGTAVPHGGNGRRKEPMTPLPPSSNRRGMKKTSVGIGRV
ncbi:MAG: hypothetical protein FJ122_09090 [Deltaproteobacteria bacterium]|nr:hypothetical protein [Deltaproteobacteria bacterium]